MAKKYIKVKKETEENWGTRGLLVFGWAFVFLAITLLGFLGGIWYCYNFIR